MILALWGLEHWGFSCSLPHSCQNTSTPTGRELGKNEDWARSERVRTTLIIDVHFYKSVRRKKKHHVIAAPLLSVRSWTNGGAFPCQNAWLKNAIPTLCWKHWNTHKKKNRVVRFLNLPIVQNLGKCFIENALAWQFPSALEYPFEFFSFREAFLWPLVSDI